MKTEIMVKLDEDGVEAVKDSYNKITSGIFSILEYNELDLIWFLSLKKRIWYYKPLLYIKSGLLIFFILCLFLTDYVYKNLLLNLTYIVFGLYIFVDYIYFKKFRYSLWYYRKRKNFLNRINNQINLIINNQLLLTTLDQEIQNFKIKQQQLNKRIKHFSTIIRPYRTHLEKIGYLIAILIPFITLLLDIFYGYIQNLDDELDVVGTSEFLLIFFRFCFNLLLFILLSLNYNHNRFNNEKRYIISLEQLLEIVILALVSLIKLVQFPDEKEKVDKLRESAEQWKLESKKKK